MKEFRGWDEVYSYPLPGRDARLFKFYRYKKLLFWKKKIIVRHVLVDIFGLITYRTPFTGSWLSDVSDEDLAVLIFNGDIPGSEILEGGG